MLEFASPLPSEPRILDRVKAQQLTEQYLLPALFLLEVFFLEVRSQVDEVLPVSNPVRRGKPYPWGSAWKFRWRSSSA